MKKLERIGKNMEILMDRKVSITMCIVDLDCIHTILAHFENNEKCDVAKFELAFTRCQNNLKAVEASIDSKKFSARL